MSLQQISNTFRVEVDGRALPATVVVEHIEVEDNLHLPDAFTLVLRDETRTALQLAGIRIGVPIEVSVLSDATPAPQVLISAEVTALEAEFSGGSSLTVVRGFDESHRLFRGRSTASYQNMTYADIAGKVASRAGLRKGTIDSTSPAHEHVTQFNESDWVFLRRIANEVGFDVSVRAGKLHFRAPTDSTDAPATGNLRQDDPLRLTLGSNLLAFRAIISAAEQVEEVQVRGWDPATKEPVVVNCPAATRTIANGSSPSAVAKEFPAAPLVLVGTPLSDPEQVTSAASAAAEHVAASLTEIEGRARGNPKLQAGKGVRLELVGEPFDGTYVLTSSIHGYDDDDGYTTSFVISGREQRSLLQLLATPSPATSERTDGAVTALVEDVDDPDGLCRVRLRFPWLSDDYVSDWCRVVQVGAGAGRGTVVLPEPDDEVLVTFEQGDIRHPFVLGGLYNLTDTPDTGPAELVDGTSKQVNNRVFTSRTGHQVVIVDAEDGSGVFVHTGDGKLSLSLDQAGERVAITSAGDLEIDVEGDITITAGGTLEMSARSMKSDAQQEWSTSAARLSLDGSGPVKVSGQPVQLN